jgi:hypothetical protein
VSPSGTIDRIWPPTRTYWPTRTLRAPTTPAVARADHGAVQIGAGDLDLGAGLFDGGQALFAGRAQHAGVALFGDQGGLGLGDRGLGGLGAGAFGLDALLRDPALLGQLAVAVDAGLGQIGLGLGRMHSGGARGDGGLFLNGAGVDIADGGGQGGQIGLGLGQLGPGVGVIQLDQDLARLDALVVADQHLGDVTVDLGADLGGVGLDEGVVGRLPALLVLPPEEAARR